MLIEISTPVFKCEEDRRVFFSRLYSLHQYDDVIAKGQNLALTLSENKPISVMHELKALCDMWGATLKILA